MNAFTPEIVLALIGAALALIFQYFPVLQQKYNALADDKQKLIMLALVVATVGIVYGLSCAGIYDTFTCDKPGALEALRMLFVTLTVNQGLHKILPKPAFFDDLFKAVLRWLTTKAG